MRERKFHKIHSLYCWRPAERVAVLMDSETMRSFVEDTFSDLDSFKMKSAMFTGLGDPNWYQAAENKLHFQLLENIDFEKESQLGGRIYHSVNGTVASELVRDFLEVFRWQYRSIDFEERHLASSEETVLTLSTHRQQSIWDRMRGKLGLKIHEYSLLASDIAELAGTAQQFQINYKNDSLKFDRGAVC